MPTLLEQAKVIPNKAPRKEKYSNEEIELFLAWVNGEISYTQAKKALKITTEAYAFFAQCARQYILSQNGNK